MFVLTFANMENCSRKDDRDKDVKEPDLDDEEGWQTLRNRGLNIDWSYGRRN